MSKLAVSIPSLEVPKPVADNTLVFPKPVGPPLPRLSRDPDSALAPLVKFLDLKTLTPEKLQLFTDTMWLKVFPHDATIAMTLDPARFTELLRRAPATTYALGDLDGIVYFNPVVEGLSAFVHIAIWSPRWLRRHAILRSILQDAANRWDLHRFSATCSTKNILYSRNLKALGFKKEGEQESAVMYSNGETGTLSIYGLLVKELNNA